MPTEKEYVSILQAKQMELEEVDPVLITRNLKTNLERNPSQNPEVEGS